MGWHVPDDWDGQSFDLMVACVPASPEWRAVVLGAMSPLVWAFNFDENTGDTDAAALIGKDIVESVDMTSLDGVIAAINNVADTIASQQQSNCNCEGGTVADPPPDDGGDLPIGPGEDFEDTAEYDEFKCAMAQGIFDQTRRTVLELNLYDVDTLFAGGIALAVSIVTALISAGPVGWGVAVVLGVVAGVVALLSRQVAIDLSDLETVMDNNEGDLVCALYQSSDAQGAFDGFMQVLNNAGGLTTLEIELVEWLLPFQMLNQMFHPDAEAIAFANANPANCSACGGTCTIAFDTVPNVDKNGVFNLPFGTGTLAVDNVARDLASEPGHNVPNGDLSALSVSNAGGQFYNPITNCCTNLRFTINSITPTDAVDEFVTWEYDGTCGKVETDYNAAVPIGVPLDVAHWYAVNFDEVPFVMNVTITSAP